MLYQKDVLEDYRILLWADYLIVSTQFNIPKEVAKEVRENASQFIEYLRAEEVIIPKAEVSEESLAAQKAAVEAEKQKIEAEIDDL